MMMMMMMMNIINMHKYNTLTQNVITNGKLFNSTVVVVYKIS